MIPGLIACILVCVILAVVVNLLAPEPTKRYLYVVIALIALLWVLAIFGVVPLDGYSRLRC